MAARAMLSRLAGDKSLEAVWLRAAAETLISGRPIDPTILVLKELTKRAQAWSGMAPWPPEAIDARAERLADCHFLAITSRDMQWLEELDQCWDDAPPFIDDTLRLRAQGQIGLGLRPRGRRPYGWTADEIALLVEEKFLVRQSPSDRAWCALAEGDHDAAQLAIKEYERCMEEVNCTWNAASDMALRQIWSYPGAVLRTECRALRALAALSS